MARHLTPDERARVVARYVETANAHTVAAEFGVSVHTVLRSAARAKVARRDTLHAQACARGVRDGRRALSKTSKRLERWLEEHGDPGSPTMEPGDISRMATALRGVVSGLVEVDEHRAKTKLSRLTRDLRRAEIELARLKIAAGGIERHELAIVTPDDAAKAAREVFGSPSALEAHGPDEAGPQALAGNVLPVSDPLDH